MVGVVACKAVEVAKRLKLPCRLDTALWGTAAGGGSDDRNGDCDDASAHGFTSAGGLRGMGSRVAPL